MVKLQQDRDILLEAASIEQVSNKYSIFNYNNSDPASFLCRNPVLKISDEMFVAGQWCQGPIGSGVGGRGDQDQEQGARAQDRLRLRQQLLDHLAL